MTTSITKVADEVWTDIVADIITRSISAWEPFVNHPWTPYAEATTEEWKRRLVDPAQFTYILESELTFVGMCSWTDESNTADASTTDGSSAHLTSLFVLPSAQGRGYGIELIRHAEEQMKSHSYLTSRLFTPIEHEAAIGFYGKRGWFPTGFVRPGNPPKAELRKELVL